MNARLRWLSLASWLLALTAPLAAQAKLTVEATLVPPTAKPGDTVELVLKAKTPATYHAYGTKEETNIPVALKPKNQKLDGFELVGAAVVPEGELHSKLGVDTYPLPEEFTVTQKLKVVTGFAGTEAMIAGALDYQLCNANMCLAPASATFGVRLSILGAKQAEAPTQEPSKELFELLEKHVSPELMPSVFFLVRHSDQVVRTTSNEVLRGVIPALKYSLGKEANAKGLDASPTSAVEKLLLQSKPGAPPEQRLLAIRSLGTLGVPEALPFLIEWTQDVDANVAKAAKDAITQIHLNPRR
jgi:hypothetical protein